MPESEIRIAVVGAGQIGKRHAELIVKSDACRLAAIVDPAPAVADYAGTLGVPHHASLAELFASERPDGVILATPNQMHCDQALACIAAGVPTLVEKPVAHTLEAGMRLCDAADAAKVPVLVGHHRRHGSIMARAIEVIES
ncbi:MAG: Gfo/Idh/MocA family oxidoreductase, partial [Casimicrobiaceae bacterium]